MFEENLMELFSRCRNCSAKTTGKVRHVIGSMIKIQQVCEVCEFTYHWQSQPIVAGKPAGNLIMSAGILFSGALPSSECTISAKEGLVRCVDCFQIPRH